jgi:cytosine/adenosine deaminase-related metal-dependent hydrolase
MASSAGAVTSGFPDAGRIEVGGAADLVVVDLERPSSPWLHPDVRPLELVVQRVQPADLSHVVLGGVIRVRHGAVEGIDVDALRDEFDASIANAAERADLAGARELADAVRRWFDEWAVAGTTEVPPR